MLSLTYGCTTTVRAAFAFFTILMLHFYRRHTVHFRVSTYRTSSACNAFTPTPATIRTTIRTFHLPLSELIRHSKQYIKV